MFVGVTFFAYSRDICSCLAGQAMCCCRCVQRCLRLSGMYELKTPNTNLRCAAVFVFRKNDHTRSYIVANRPPFVGVFLVS